MTKQQVIMHATLITFLLLLAISSEYSGFDIFWASRFYDAAHHTWPYKKTFITATLLHDTGKNFVAALFTLNLFSLIASFFYKNLAPYRKALSYLLLATLSGPVIVNLLKAQTHIYTPWKLELFNSYRPYIRFFDPVPGNLPTGHAFPGGHSSGGFAFIGLYFYASATRHPHRYYALAFPLILGGAFAINQEIRGAHFISHDLVSLSICWFSALFWYLVLYGMYDDKLPMPALVH